MKKSIFIALSLLLAIAMIAGCTNSQTPGTDPTAQTTTADPGKTTADPATEPSTEINTAEVIPMTVMVAEYANVKYPRNWDRPGMAAVKAIALEQFGIDIELEEISTVETKSIINTRLAADVDLPDILSTEAFTLLEIDDLYKNGKIISYSDYAEYMPNILETLEKIPSLKLSTMNSDGKILSCRQVVYNRQHVTTWGHIRHDWLQTLGMDYPTTIQELRDTIIAFQENDMNGNGKKDETLYLNGAATASQVFGPAFGAYDLVAANNAWHADESGTVVHAMTTDNAKAYLAFMSGMYKDGLIWQQSFTATTEERNAYEATDAKGAFVSAFWDSVIQNLDGFSKNRPHEFTPILPLAGEGYASKMKIRNYLASSDKLITKACGDPARAVTFMDYFYTAEGSQIQYLGEVSPGGEWYSRDILVEQVSALGLEADPLMMALTPKGQEQAAKEENIQAYLGVNYGIWPSNLVGLNDTVVAEFATGFDPEAGRIASDVKRNKMLLDWTNDSANTYAETSFAAPTAEQSDAIRDAAELYTYMDEMFVKFLTGAESLDQWDSFLKTCKDAGLEDITAVMQARHDTYKSFSK